MTGFDYPPTRTYRLGDLAESDDLSGAQAEAMAWAVEEFGEDATITLQAPTAMERAHAIDKLNQAAVGDVGAERVKVWIVTATLQEAPWLADDDDQELPMQAQMTGALPPAFLTWLQEEMDDLSSLGGEGN